MRRQLGEMSFLRLHTLIGIVGYILPFALIMSNYKCGMQSSMSSCWYTEGRDIFVGCLYLFSGFFFANEGYDMKDKIAFKICSICFFLIANFPCEQNTSPCSLFSYIGFSFHSIVHYVSAIICFITLGVICFFLFPLTAGRFTEEKRKRNVLYKTCGVIIFSCVGVLIISQFIKTIYFITFLLEIIMLYSFCTAFIIKGTKGKALSIEDN